MLLKAAKLILILSLPILVGASCSLSGSGSQDGGVWLSADKGESWEHKTFVRQEKKKRIGIDDLNVTALKNHPRDSRIIYANTDRGLYFTESAADQWSSVFTTGALSDFSLDPDVRGILYAAFGRTILKTTDNGRTWQQRYLEPRAETLITRIVVDPLDNSRIYAGNTSGDIIASLDFGKSWQVISNFADSIRNILVNDKDNAFVYVATARKGIFASFNRGETWQNLREFYADEFKTADRYQQLVFDKTGQSSLVYASAYGLLKSEDGGFNWIEVPTISPPGSVTYRSLAVNPTDADEIYYATDDVFVRTFDAGQNWIASQLPTSRSAGAMLVDWFDENRVYLGARRVKK